MREISTGAPNITSISDATGSKDFKTWETQYQKRVAISNQEYQQKYMKLADRLMDAKTGYTMCVGSDNALILDGYGTHPDYGSITMPLYKGFLFNEGAHADCEQLVNSLIKEAEGLRFLAAQMQKRQKIEAEAAKSGLPGQLRFPRLSGEDGPGLQTWIISPEGTTRNCDYTITIPNGDVVYECWDQLLPREIVATWGKPYISAPHQFSMFCFQRLSRYDPCQCVTLGSMPVGEIFAQCLDMSAFDVAERAANTIPWNVDLVTVAQLECLYYLQTGLNDGYEGLADPIYGEPSPDIKGGWLRLLGIEPKGTLDKDVIE